MLSEDFKHRELVVKARRRRVRTPAGAKKYGQPIGTVIRRDMLAMIEAAGAKVTGEGRKMVGDGGGRKKPAKAAPPKKTAPPKKAAAPRRRIGPGRGVGTKTKDVLARQRAAAPPKKAAPKAPPKAATPPAKPAGEFERKQRVAGFKERLDQVKAPNDLRRVMSDVRNDKNLRIEDRMEIRDHVAKVRDARKASHDRKVDEKVVKPVLERVASGRAARERAANKGTATKEADRLIAAIDAAQTQDDLDKVKADVRRNWRNVRGMDTANKKRVNDKFRDRGKEFKNRAFDPARDKQRIANAKDDQELAAILEDIVRLDNEGKIDQTDFNSLVNAISDRNRVFEQERINRRQEENKRRQADGVRRRIRDAKDENALGNILDDAVRMNQRGALDGDAFDSIINAVEARQRVLSRQDKGLAVQRKHFANGKGSISDAPSENLWEFVNNDTSGRFTVKANGDKGISPNFWVTDNGKVPPERWMFKRATISNDDVMWESLAANLMRAAGLPMPETKYASGVEGDKGDYPWMAQRHIQEGDHALKGKILPTRNYYDWNGLRSEVIENMKKGSDPDAVARLAVFDYLINNWQDRHAKNIMVIDEGGGRAVLGIIDQGFAFGNARGKTNQTPVEFFRDYRANGWKIFQAIKEIGGGNANLQRQFDRTIDAFAKVDLDSLMSDLMSRGLSRSAEADLKKWTEAMRWRLEYLKNNRGEMVRITNEKGI